MNKKILVILIICLTSLFLTGCKHKADHIEIYNKDSQVFDNINIDVKEGYFYDRHEKFTVDDNTIGITIYFSNDENKWE